MSKYIDADELKKVFLYSEDAEYTRWTLSGVIDEIDDIEAADVQEVRHGRWKEEFDGIDTIYECSVCGEPFVTIEGTPADNLWHYCPNCGASMDEVSE